MQCDFHDSETTLNQFLFQAMPYILGYKENMEKQHSFLIAWLNSQVHNIDMQVDFFQYKCQPKQTLPSL